MWIAGHMLSHNVSATENKASVQAMQCTLNATKSASSQSVPEMPTDADDALFDYATEAEFYQSLPRLIIHKDSKRPIDHEDNEMMRPMIMVK